MGKRINTAVWVEKANRWQLNVQKDGKRKTFVSSINGREGQREANRKADDWLDKNIDHTSTRISDLLDVFCISIQETTSKSNYLQIESICHIWIKPNIGNRKISAVSEGELQDIINKACKKGLARKTLTNIRAVIMSFYKYCRLHKTTNLYPEHIAIPKSAIAKGKKVLQPQDLQKLFTKSKTMSYGKIVDDEHIHAYRYMVLTGMRPGELIALERKNVTDNNYNVKITGAINYLNEKTTGKNDNAIRHFVNTELAKKELDMQPIAKDSIYFFGDMTYNHFALAWKNYCKFNDIDNISLYELRHTFVSIVKNLPNGQILPLIGHSKNMDTFGTYGHELNGELNETAKKINELFKTQLIKK